MKITSKGQVTIPVDLQKRAGLLPGTEVEFYADDEGVVIVKVSSIQKSGRGARLIAHMRGRGVVSMTTDDIMVLTRGE